VAPDLIAGVVADRGHEIELATALLVLEDRAPPSLGDDRARDRAWRLLVRRGYTPEIAYDAVRAYERRSSEERRRAA
jgi:SOS response regulatory protein OraA/RecX